MDEKNMVDDLVKMLDSGMAMGVGHVNVDCDAEGEESKMFRPWDARIAPGHPLRAAFPPWRMGWMIFINTGGKDYHVKFYTGR